MLTNCCAVCMPAFIAARESLAPRAIFAKKYWGSGVGSRIPVDAESRKFWGRELLEIRDMGVPSASVLCGR
jgi:hypothetical protein